MIEIECPMCEVTVSVELAALELHCGGCAVTVDLVDDRDVLLALAA